MARSFRGDKRQREAERKRRQQQKRERLQKRRDLREQGLDPDRVDADGRPLAYSEVASVDDIVPTSGMAPPRPAPESVEPLAQPAGEPTTLHVGGLSYDVTEEELRSAFERFGEITHVAVVVDKTTGDSRGFGYVTFKAASDGRAAMSSMHGTTLGSGSIRVTQARLRTGS
jgi:RNA recognition motif-containing protein